MKPNLGAVGMLAALTVIGASATACAGQSSGLAQQDQTYLIQHAQTDMAEIAAGQLAVQKGTTDQIRATGQTLIQDHQRGLDQAKSIAQTKHVTLPSTPDQTQQQQTDQLKNASGVAFDQTYLRNQIQAHQQSISQTQQELRSGTDPQIKQFAQSYLPVAQAHLQRLDTDQQQLNTSTPKAANTGSGGEAATTPRDRLVGGLLGAGALLVYAAAALFAWGRRDPRPRG
jgi:putative membrane protein